MNIQGIGKFCKNYREKVLDLTLANFCREMDCDYKTLWAWEHGQSTNIKNVSYYWNCSEDQLHREYFSKGLFENL